VDVAQLGSSLLGRLPPGTITHAPTLAAGFVGRAFGVLK
jgi:hypothetical protein